MRATHGSGRCLSAGVIFVALSVPFTILYTGWSLMLVASAIGCFLVPYMAGRSIFEGAFCSTVPLDELTKSLSFWTVLGQ